MGAITRSSLASGDILFSGGEMPEEPQMFFITVGSMIYAKEGSCSIYVETGSWACEAMLWTPWVYRGVLRARTDSNIMHLDTTKFQTIACQFLSSDADPRKYGKEFVKHLNGTPKGLLTDLDDETFDTCE